jgi:hypothetical protein
MTNLNGDSDQSCKFSQCDDPPVRLGLCRHHWEWLNGIPPQVAETMENAVKADGDSGELVERLRDLHKRATEPRPEPLPEQDSRVGEAMAGRQDQLNAAEWRGRTEAAKDSVVALLPQTLAALSASNHAELSERVTKLREALEPFAKVAIAFDYWDAEVMPTFDYPTHGTRLEFALQDCPQAIGALTESDFRKARALLTDKGGE